MYKIGSVIIISVLMTGCISASSHRSDRVTVGKVQREIRIGMTNAEVIEVLGSPNVVTTDEERRENWVYDKISTDSVHSSSGTGLLPALILGYSAGASSRSQKTLTIIVKFDKDHKVRDFAYHTSRF